MSPAAESPMDQPRVEETDAPEGDRMEVDVTIATETNDDPEIIDLEDHTLLLDSSSESDSSDEDTEEAQGAETKSLAPQRTPVGTSSSGQNSPDTTIVTNPLSSDYDLHWPRLRPPTPGKDLDHKGRPIIDTYDFKTAKKLNVLEPNNIRIVVDRQLEMISRSKGNMGRVQLNPVTLTIRDEPDSKLANEFWTYKHFLVFLTDRIRARFDDEYPIRVFDMFELPYSAKFKRVSYMNTKIVNGKHQDTIFYEKDLSDNAPSIDRSRIPPRFKHVQGGIVECWFHVLFELSYTEPHYRQVLQQCPEKIFLQKVIRCIHDEESATRTIGTLLEAYEEMKKEYYTCKNFSTIKPKTFDYRPDARPLIWENIREFNNSDYVREREKHNNDAKQKREEADRQQLVIQKKDEPLMKKPTTPSPTPTKTAPKPITPSTSPEKKVTPTKRPETPRPPEGPTRAEKLVPDVTHPVVEQKTEKVSSRVIYKRKRNKIRRATLKRSSTDVTAPDVQKDVTATDAQQGGKKKDAPTQNVSDPDSAPPKKKKKKTQQPEKATGAPKPQQKGPEMVSTNQLVHVPVQARLEPRPNFEQAFFSQPPPATQLTPIRTFDYGHGKHFYVPQTGLTYREVAPTPRGGGRGKSNKSRGGSRGFKRNSSGPVYYEVTNSVPFVPGEH